MSASNLPPFQPAQSTDRLCWRAVLRDLLEISNHLSCIPLWVNQFNSTHGVMPYMKCTLELAAAINLKSTFAYSFFNCANINCLLWVPVHCIFADPKNFPFFKEGAFE